MSLAQFRSSGLHPESGDDDDACSHRNGDGCHHLRLYMFRVRRGKPLANPGSDRLRLALEVTGSMFAGTGLRIWATRSTLFKPSRHA